MATFVIPTAWQAKVASRIGGGTDNLVPATFKIGEGGWVDVGGVPTPRTPDPSLSDIDCVENPTRYPVDSRFSFTKALISGRVTVDANEVTINCIVDTSEANNDGFDNAPEFWELGVFDGEGDMMLYGTFSAQPKTDRVLLQHQITVTIQGS